MTTRRILVVDDNPDVAGIIRLATQKLPERVEIVGEVNADRALRRLREDSFDLVIADYKLREMDGLTFLANAPPARAHEKRLMFTAYAGKLEGHPEAAAKLDGFLEKPMMLDVLREILDAVLHEDPATLSALRGGLAARLRTRPSRP